MQNRTKIIILLVVQLMLSESVIAQNVYTRVSVYPKSVYVGQPCKYSVKIYTDTWFTDGAEFAPFNLGDAFVVPAANQVGSERINGKTYSYVEHNYWIYPYNKGDLNIPQQKVVVHSPAPGQFKAEPQVKITKAATLNVIANPPNIPSDSWVVAQSMTRKDSWSRPVKDIKVGEVLERTVDIQAMGTMAAFMPSLNWGAPEGISIYPQTADLKTETPDRTSSIFAREKQTVAYLFEKEGTHTIPAVKLGYWNVKQHRWIDQSLPEIQIEVLPNEDLSVLASHKEMLDATMEDEETVLTEEQTESFNWMKLLKWTILIIGSFVVLLLIVKSVKLINRLNNKRKESEGYAYRQMIKVAKAEKTYYKWLYNWLNSVSSEKSLESFVRAKASPQLKEDFNSNYDNLLGKKQNHTKKQNFFKALRTEIKHKKSKEEVKLNP